MEEFNEIQRLLRDRAECQARISMIPYDGSPEIKENSSGRYLYIRKRYGSRLSSTYVDVFSEELYEQLLRYTKENRQLRKNLRKIDKRLSELGYQSFELQPQVVLNLDFARANLKVSIYDQAVLEGIATSYPQTEEIIDNGIVNGMTSSDIQKVLNLKHAWEFILDTDVIQVKTDFYLLCHIAKLVNEGFFLDAGRVRSVPVSIGGSTYKPPIPDELTIKERIDEIITQEKSDIDIAIELCMYCMKSQIFIDGNKRASVIFANHFLISRGQGLLVIPEHKVSEFKDKLIAYYEGKPLSDMGNFLKTDCWQQI